MLPRYLSVTAEQIREVAAATFRADNRVVLTYLPERRRPTPPDDGPTTADEAAETRWRHDRHRGSSPSGRRPARRGRTSSRRSSGTRLVERPDRARSSTCPAGRSSSRRWSSATAPPTSPPARAARRSSRPGPCPRAPSATTRSSSSRPPSGWARRSTPRPAGTRRRPASTCRRRASRRRSSCSPRWSPGPTFPEARGRAPPRRAPERPAPGRADPRRRADEAFAATIYSRRLAVPPPAGGTRETVERLDRDALRARLRSGRSIPPARRSIVARRPRRGIDVAGHRRAAVRRLARGPRPPATAARSSPTARVDERLVRVVHRPGAVQTEIRIGHRRACRAGSRTSTRSRSWARSSAACSTPG